jgi:VacB/RNase II family 3'-5' exoribonuclease
MTDVDLRARAREVLREAGFEPGFSVAALAEAQQAAAVDPAADRTSVVDQRARLWSSIDNASSRDLDQLEWAERLGPHQARLAVAIADVDALAPPGSAIDQHAATNTTSIYTALDTFSMIPERLSADLSSLLPDTDRRALVFEMIVADDGQVHDARVTRAVVRNRARLAYGDVGAWLEGRGDAPGRVGSSPELADQLRLQREIAGWLRARRREQGALEFDSREVRAVSEGGRVTGLEETTRNAARDLIEDLMLTTNTALATLCEAANISWIRRIVRSPERWDRIAALARELGTELPATPNGPALAAFLRARKAAAPDKFPELSLAVIKLIGKGEYAVERKGEDLEGHFGLALGDYTHGTAPNRRYADLVMQRLLKATLHAAAAPYSDAALDAIARRCTEREDEARRVERKLGKIAAAAWLATRVGESFDATVTGVSSKGTFARVTLPPVEGRVVSGEAGLDVGDRIRVRLVNADAQRGFIDFVGLGRAR